MGCRTESRSEIEYGHSDRSTKHYAPERDDENLRLLKKSFEEILTREYRKYGGIIQ